MRKNKLSYEESVELFKSISNELGRPIKFGELINNTWGLPSSRWFVEHCPDKSVKNFNNFIEWCGFKPRYNMSKEKAIEMIYEMRKKLNRPLNKYDFENTDENSVGRSTIINYWGNMNNMKKELGLEIIQEYMADKSKPIEELKCDIDKLCKEIYECENRKVIMADDINKSKYTLNYGTYNRIFKKELGITLREYLRSIGFDLFKSGTGLNYQFEDGEYIRSQFELIFSRHLRSIGLKYNVDYYRDVKYRTFIKDYNGFLDCDYVINYNDTIHYVEIAGILRDYKSWYYENKPLKSKSKERYRLKLLEKETMLKNNNLKYDILFPSDLQKDFLFSI